MIFVRDDFRDDIRLLRTMRIQMQASGREIDRRNWKIFWCWLHDTTYEKLGAHFGISKHRAMEIVHKCCRTYNRIKKEAA